MKTKLIGFGLFLLIFSIQTNFAAALPVQIKSYLDKTYKGWKLSPSEKYCSSETNNGVVKGNFNNDRITDYAVKFTRGKKGYIIAFLAQKQNYKPFILHNTDADDVKKMGLSIWKKGTKFELSDQNVFVKYDAPADFRCESDVGGIHLYRNGKFVAY
jgi:hypothetical protein